MQLGTFFFSKKRVAPYSAAAAAMRTQAKEGQLEKTGRDMAATVKTYMERTERADASKENATAVAIMLQATIDELTEQYKVKERRYKQQLTN